MQSQHEPGSRLVRISNATVLLAMGSRVKSNSSVVAFLVPARDDISWMGLCGPDIDQGYAHTGDDIPSFR